MSLEFDSCLLGVQPPTQFYEMCKPDKHFLYLFIETIKKNIEE